MIADFVRRVNEMAEKGRYWQTMRSFPVPSGTGTA